MTTPNASDGTAAGYYQVNGILNGTLFLHDGVTPLQNGQFITYAQGAAGLKFTPALNSTSDGSFTVQAATIPSSGGLVATPVTATIVLNGPLNNVPAMQTTPQNAPLVFAVATNNAISISDAHAGTASAVSVTLSATTGTVTLSTVAGLTISGGGNGQGSVSVSGTVAAINAALDGLTFTPAAQYNGPASLTLTTTDAQLQVSATNTVPITVGSPGPTVATAASATPSPVAGTSTALSVLGADAAGEGTLTYTWATIGTPPAPVAFSANGTNAAKDTVATFIQAGAYTFQVTIADAGGLTTSSTVSVTVAQTLTSILVTPAPTVALNEGATQQFAATAYDQFGAAMAAQPAFAWTVGGVGAVDAAGLYTAPAAVGTATITAASGAASGAVRGGASVTVAATAPTVATAASATPSPVAGTSTALSVLGADAAGEGTLTYTWATIGTPPAPVTFSANGTNAAKDTVATFIQAGAYTFQVTIADAGGLTTSSTVSVTVAQTLTSILVTPGPTVALNEGATQQFAATAYDQFGAAMAAQPAFGWSASGAGTVDAAGMYTAPPTVGAATVTAASGSVSGGASVTVASSAPTVATAASATPSPVAGTSTALSVLGADVAGEGTLTYTWATVGTPPAAVTFSANGTNAAKDAVATFTRAGSYTFRVTIAEAGGLSTSSLVTVTVAQTLSAIAVTPASTTTLDEGTTQRFTATAYDQFGLALAAQPTFAWFAGGIGAVDATGLYTAPATFGTATVTAASGSVSGGATVTVTNAAPTIAAAASAPPGAVAGTTALLSGARRRRWRRGQPPVHLGDDRRAARAGHVQRQRRPRCAGHDRDLPSGRQLHLPRHRDRRGRALRDRRHLGDRGSDAHDDRRDAGHGVGGRGRPAAVRGRRPRPVRKRDGEPAGLRVGRVVRARQRRRRRALRLRPARASPARPR